MWNVPSKTPALSSYSAARAALEQHTAASTAMVPSLLSNRTSKDVHFAVPSPSTRSVIEQLYTLMLENDLRVHRRSCSQSPCAHRCSFLSSCLQLRLQQTCAHRRSSLFMRLFVRASSAGARVRARPPALTQHSLFSSASFQNGHGRVGKYATVAVDKSSQWGFVIRATHLPSPCPRG